MPIVVYEPPAPRYGRKSLSGMKLYFTVSVFGMYFWLPILLPWNFTSKFVGQASAPSSDQFGVKKYSPDSSG